MSGTPPQPFAVALLQSHAPPPPQTRLPAQIGARTSSVDVVEQAQDLVYEVLQLQCPACAATASQPCLVSGQACVTKDLRICPGDTAHQPGWHCAKQQPQAECHARNHQGAHSTFR